ncbi:MAG: sulfate ABC transporter permease subunit CysW, partial [Snowella sp.]
MQSISKSSKYSKYILIAIALLYLFLVLLIPAASAFYEAFHKGFGPFLEAIQQPDFQEAVKLTLIIALIAVPLNTVFGLCTAWVVARNQFRGRALFMSIVDVPFSISPVVAGLMIVLLYGRNGWFGHWLEVANIKIIFALPGMVLATIFVTLPFVAREVIP